MIYGSKNASLTKALLIACLLLSASCKNTVDSYRKKVVVDSIATRESVLDVHIEYTDSGLLRAKVYTPELVAVKNVSEPYMEMNKGINVRFLDQDGKVESCLTSEYAISYSEKKKIIVRRNVEVLNLKGERMNTEELVWDQASAKIRTDKFVKITTKDQIIMGEGMESDESFNNWEILNVRGTLNIKNNDTSSRNKSALPCGSGDHGH